MNKLSVLQGVLFCVGIALVVFGTFVVATEQAQTNVSINTQAICTPNDKGIVCEDYYFVYNGNDAPIKLRTNLQSQHPSNWVDPRGTPTP